MSDGNMNLDNLKKLREPFPAHQISKLPKGTKAQNECDKSQKRKCNICGGFHHPDIIHLDYVGHAALTDRLLDADPLWSWEPLAYKDGLPAFDATGGLWIKLTVCGHTRIGYGHAASASFKDIGSREKEVIGDALRNAAMRFGAALDLWHKGDLHGDDEPREEKKKNGNYRPAYNVLGFNPRPAADTPLEPEDKKQVEDVVEKALKWLAQNKVADAVLEIDNAGFHSDQWLYVNSFFDSTQRRLMKAEAARLKEEFTKKDLATQA
jgi:hypothetical protein